MNQTGMLEIVDWDGIEKGFEAMAKGVLALNDVGYFFIIMVVWLYASLIVIEQKKAD